MKKSKGHIGFTKEHEYISFTDGCIYRAPKDAPIDTNGWRQGMRFESHEEPWDNLGKNLVEWEVPE